MKQLFNDGWSFKKTDIDCSYEAAITDCGWKRVDIPHDWLIYQANDLYETSCGWYKKSFSVNSEGVYKLYFGGVYMDSTVYINGKAAGEWKYGYSSFEIDITDYVTSGENTAVVQVRHRAPNSRWYSGAGIYRNVYFISHRSAYIKTDSVYFSAKQDNDDSWTVKLSSVTEGTDDNYKMQYTASNNSGMLFEAEAECGKEITFTVSRPDIWDVDAPLLYTLSAKLILNGEVIDEQSCKTGFRDVRFEPDSGCFLNGRNIKLHGVCLHHDLGCLGAAVNRAALRRQLMSMKNMGVNAVRTSHNPPSTEFMELCDEIGLLVDSEAFDMWELKKTDYDYARFFDEWYQRDVESWVCRDRNHPSVIMWSIGNEIYDTHASERGAEVTRMLRDEVRKHDYNHNGYVTIGSNYIEWDGAQNCAKELELSGYNYGERLYEEHHKKYPDWCIYGSETASRVQSRGVYHFPKSAAYVTHDDLQCSSLENCRAGLTERTSQTSIIADRDTPFCAGQFIWTGSDYIGEPTPYSTKNSYYGMIDTAGFIKDTYYLYEAAWTDKTVLHLMPYWDFNDGQLIDVMVYTNQPCVELFFNGVSMGKRTVEGVYSADWQLPYEKGTLKAVSYDESGNITAEDSLTSFGETAELRLTPDKDTLKADGEDMIFVDISAYDKAGNFTANARNRVNVTVTGAGRLAGLDSGDSTDYDEYKGNSKKLFSGRLLAAVKAKDFAGDINIKVSSSGLNDAEITLKAVSAEFAEGTADAFEENISCPKDEIPVRKIEISASGQHLDAENDTAEIIAKIYPENAEYNIEWTAVTESGVKTNIASVEGDGGKAVVRAEGDGKFRLRCFCRNGKPAPEVISELEMNISGIGSVTVNPYKELVKGSLHNISFETLNEVSQGGVNIQKEGRNMVGFRNVDFGMSGSDKLTVNIICWFNNDPVEFSVWDGIPHGENSEKIADFSYRADFIWQTYIPNTFELPYKLKGVHDICFEFAETDRQIYFGGFIFGGGDSYSAANAADNTEIYGDSYTVTGNSVEHIGNNVYIDFEGFDFERGVKAVTLRGRTHNPKDSVHMRIIGEEAEIREILEFELSEEYIEKTFDLKDFKGKAKVRFEFLPGCDFDFESFRIEPRD